MKKRIHTVRNSLSAQYPKIGLLVRHRYAVPFITFWVVIFCGLVMYVVAGASTVGASDKRIVMVSIEGENRTVSTRARTVGGLIDRLSIDLIDKDIVEPALETPIYNEAMQVNIYKARPVQIIDRERTITFLTAERSPERIVRAAGIDLRSEDTVEFTTNESTKLEFSAPEQVRITRSIAVQLNIYSALRTHYTQAESVAEVLRENKIEIGEGEAVLPGSDATVFDGMVISINKEGVVTKTAKEDVDFGRQYEDDPEKEVGFTQLKKAGIMGERTVIYEVLIDEEGDEISRKEIRSLQTKDPIDAIYVRGTKAPMLDPNTSVESQKRELMRSAGIPEDMHVYVDYIIRRESGWRPGARNPSSGAYGLCQSLPASKMASAGADWETNPVTQLRWCNSYALERPEYGSWAAAYDFWVRNKWW